jgi:hypothetical protein
VINVIRSSSQGGGNVFAKVIHLQSCVLGVTEESIQDCFCGG